MKTILVPTDFSATARNAALYAIEFAIQTGAKKVVLYNSYQSPVTIDPMMPTVHLLDMEPLKQNSEKGLESLKAELAAMATTSVQLDTINEFNLLTTGIEEACKTSGADLIIMGITGGGALEETFIGSNTVHVARHSTVPVIIVPALARFNKIKELLLACDYKKVLETTPVTPIKNMVSATGARLLVLNVHQDKKEYSSDFTHESLILDTLLIGCHPEYFFVENPDFTEAINDFVEEQHVDMIITIPKKHGWFEGLFRKSHTRMLAFHSTVPLMVIHE